jgi:hypothetical protein
MKPGHLGKTVQRKWKAITSAIEWRVRAKFDDERLDAVNHPGPLRYS